MNKPQQAEFILNHPLIQEFFETLHAQLYQALKKASTDEQRNKLAAYGRFGDEFERFLKAYVASGKAEAIAEELKEKEQTALEKLKARFPRW